MEEKMKIRKYLLIFLLLFTSIYAEVTIIGNKSTNITITNANSAFDYFTMAKGNLKVFYLKSGSANDEFFSFIGKDFNEMKKIWMRLQLTEGKIAVALNSEDEMLEKVASTPNSIGYVSTSKVNSNVKSIFTIK